LGEEKLLTINRRSLLKSAGFAIDDGGCSGPQGGRETAGDQADCKLRIATGVVELAPDHIVSTTRYNGQFPGPLLRLKQDIRNS
jgi:hypothetical protein